MRTAQLVTWALVSHAIFALIMETDLSMIATAGVTKLAESAAAAISPVICPIWGLLQRCVSISSMMTDLILVTFRVCCLSTSKAFTFKATPSAPINPPGWPPDAASTKQQAIDLALSQKGPSSEINAANCGVNGQASDVLLRGPSSLNPSMCLLHLFSNSHFTLSLCHNVYSHTHENALSTAYWPPLCPRALHPGPHQDHHAFQTPRCSQ